MLPQGRGAPVLGAQRAQRLRLVFVVVWLFPVNRLSCFVLFPNPIHVVAHFPHDRAAPESLHRCSNDLVGNWKSPKFFVVLLIGVWGLYKLYYLQ